MTRFGISLFAALALAVGALTGTASAGVLYAPEYSNSVLDAFNTSNPGGGLTPIAGSPFAVSASAIDGWAMSPDAKIGVASYLFALAQPFLVASNGAITPAQSQLSALNVGATSVAVSPNGKFVYVTTRHFPGSGPAGVRAYAIAPSGTMTELAGSPYITLDSYWDVAVTPDGSRLFVSDGSAIFHASIGSNGVPAFEGSQSAPLSDYLATSPDGRFVYSTGHDGGMTSLQSFSIGDDGELTQVGPSIVTGDGTPRAPAVAPNAQFIYTADSNADNISTIRIAPDGTPSLLGTPTYFLDGDALVATADGKYLYAAGQGGNVAIGVSPIGADGRPTGFTKAVDHADGEPIRISLRPGQGTNADFTAAATSKVLEMGFDATKTTSNLGGLGDFGWNFGDSASASSAAPITTHKFAKAGVYDVTLTAADDAGCTTRFIYTGQTTVCNGAASSVKSVRIDTPPWITSLKVSPSKVNKKTKVKFAVTEQASVAFYVQRPANGRTVGASCKKQTSKNKKAKKCTIWVRASKTFIAAGKADKTNALKFTGKVGKKKLAKGSYRIYAVATDSVKATSPAVTAKFKIKK